MTKNSIVTFREEDCMPGLKQEPGNSDHGGGCFTYALDLDMVLWVESHTLINVCVCVCACTTNPEQCD